LTGFSSESISQMASLQSDEEAIRQLVETWMAASKARNLSTVLSFMADVNFPPVCSPSGNTTMAWPNARSVRPSFARTRRELPSSEMGGLVSTFGDS